MKLFSLLSLEYPPILTPGDMLSHPGGWDKPIPEVIHLWHHKTSTPNNLEKSRLVCVLDIFCTFLGKNEKNNQSPHWGRDLGIPSSCPIFATSTTWQASSWIANLGHGKPRRVLQILDTRMGFPRPSLNVALDSINLNKESCRIIWKSPCFHVHVHVASPSAFKWYQRHSFFLCRWNETSHNYWPKGV